MSKTVKDLMTVDIGRWCDEVGSACVVDISGLDAIRTNNMRGELKKDGIHMHVVKNSMARRALAGGLLEPLAKDLTGPCCLVYGEPAVTDIAKSLAKWATANKEISLKNGIMDGDPDLISVEELSRMKGKTELLGEIGMLAASPGRSIAGALAGAGGQIAGCLKAMADKADKADAA